MDQYFVVQLNPVKSGVQEVKELIRLGNVGQIRGTTFDFNKVRKSNRKCKSVRLSESQSIPWYDLSGVDCASKLTPV